MPVRQLMYAGKLYDKYIRRNKLNIYGKKPVRLPVPKLITFYNGIEGKGDEVLKLSDAFEADREAAEPDIEVKVRMVNINYGKDQGILGACKPLSEYAWLVERIRKNRSKMDIDQAVDQAIDEMPEEYEIRKFLVGHRAEVKGMCITEYNEAETLQMIRMESREEGRQEGREEGERTGAARINRLNTILIAANRLGDLKRASEDALYQEKLIKELLPEK